MAGYTLQLSPITATLYTIQDEQHLNYRGKSRIPHQFLFVRKFSIFKLTKFVPCRNIYILIVYQIFKLVLNSLQGILLLPKKN